ncbi:DDB1- and CUL4-associated factor 10 homolog isoform X2 [Cylas formicarius]|uniref:DDB1- and CUL4-associated factor 10 homolog isoform X2 n=1 Tax=Cylas formicarius TaxID=197179 RepID=UPI002958A410|nr:DDB1- and CUL4-associated factor 10 homolog isoform X2 [Cylas formicarius]
MAANILEGDVLKNSKRICSNNSSAFNKSHILEILNNRPIGNVKKRLGFSDNLIFNLYNSFDSVQQSNYHFDKYWGGIFNLEFSLDGKLVVAACEGKQILLFDAANHKQLKVVENAHQNCVNCVRFLNEQTFATSSDDTLIKLWDVRNIKSAVVTLHGHTNWVKNIEWSEQEQVMVTSAFDGTIYAWNLANITETNMLFDKVFLMKGLMRMKLTPDGTKMIIATTTGYMIIIHDLNLLTLATDLKYFQPNLYRLMQMSDQSFPVATPYNHLFNPHRKRNRIEFIDDFPNEAEAISSLQIHPHGWSAVSRNLNGSENEEWTTVHDIQDRDPKDYENAYVIIEDINTDDDSDEFNNRRPTDLWMGYISIDDYNNFNRSRQEDQNIYENVQIPSMGIHHPEEKNKIIRNLPRMTHYIKEKSLGKGFIKELCFSSDGRIICSPYDKGVRLLAFNEYCHELSMCVPEIPQQLKTIVEMNDYHRDIVVSCKFSPTHYQLVSGCLGSDIKWYQPVL